MAKGLKTIYELFNSYTKEQIDTMLEQLTEDDKTLLVLRYGENLDNPILGNLTRTESKRLYSYLIPKMKRLLYNQNNKKIPVTENTQTNPISNDSTLDENIEDSTNKNLIRKTVIDDTVNIEVMTEDDYLKILELLKTPSFTNMMNVYSPKEAMIVSLKLGYIDGKFFSNSTISEFLGIEEQEIIDITKKILLASKERLNHIIDEIITSITEETETLPPKTNRLFYNRVEKNK